MAEFRKVKVEKHRLFGKKKGVYDIQRKELESTKKEVRNQININYPDYIEYFDELIIIPHKMPERNLAYTGGNVMRINPRIIENKELLKLVILHETAHHIIHENGGEVSLHDDAFYEVLRNLTGKDEKDSYNERGELKSNVIDVLMGDHQ